MILMMKALFWVTCGTVIILAKVKKMDSCVYLEFLVEDKSGEKLLRHILEKYQKSHDRLIYNINSFKGIGRLPLKGGKVQNIKTRQLLTDLPSYLRGFNKSLSSLPGRKAIVVVVDNDNNECKEFKNELTDLAMSLGLETCIVFCLAIEEMEAWLLGDSEAVMKAFPHAKKPLLQGYRPDSIIGTWEYLADTVYNGGARKLKKNATSYFEIGEQKCIWADEIGIHLNLHNNRSPSFNYLLSKLDMLCG